MSHKPDGDKPGKRKRKAPALRIVGGAASSRKAVRSSETQAKQGEEANGLVVVHLAKGQGKNEWGLTSKQEAFSVGVGSRGETLAVAYRAAYDAANMAPATVHNEACKLMARPEIAARVNELVRERQTKTSHDAARIKAHVIERLHAESIDPDSPPAARVRALELLGKLSDVAAFKERVATETHDAAPADLAATLEAKLKAMLAKAG